MILDPYNRGQKQGNYANNLKGYTMKKFIINTSIAIVFGAIGFVLVSASIEIDNKNKADAKAACIANDMPHFVKLRGTLSAYVCTDIVKGDK
mgnify:CR=1 FL=1